MILLRSAVLMACCSALLLAGCGQRSETELLTSARAHLAKGDAAAAMVEMKQALQANANSAEARYELGRALLELGDMNGALLELRKAADLKYPDEKLAPAMSRALIGLLRYGDVVQRYGSVDLKDPDDQAELKSNLAVAYALQGKMDKASESVDQALRTRPGHVRALVLRARLLAAGGKLDAGFKVLDDLNAQYPNSVDAWQARGELLLDAKGDAKGAAEAYRSALKQRKDNLPSHVGLHTALMRLNDTNGVAEHLKQMEEVLPKHPLTRFYAAQLAFMRNDFANAKELTQQLLKLNPEEPKFLQLAAIVSIQQQAWRQAESYLRKTIQLTSDEASKRFPTRLLAQTYLRSGQSAKALETLQPVLEAPNLDAATLVTAAETYVHMGDLQRAEEYFRRAAELRPDDARVRTALAAGRLSRGDSEGAFAELERIAAGTKDDVADLALISVRSVRREYDQALAAIDKLERKDPAKALPHHLRGKVLISKGDPAGARSSFEKAVALDPRHLASITALVGLDLRDNKPDAARKRFEDLLKLEPAQVEATMALAQIMLISQNQPAEAAKIISDLIAKKPTEAAPRVWLVNYYIERRDGKTALQVAQEAAAALPDSPVAVDALGRAQLISGEPNQAVVTFQKLATMLPRSPEPLMRLSDAYVANRDYPAATLALHRALEVSPQLLPAHRGLVNLAIRTGKRDVAIAQARQMQKDKTLAPMGYLFEGDVELGRRKYDAAIAAYRNGLKLSEIPEVAVKLHLALRGAGNRAEADKFASSWLAGHPKDGAFLFHLGGIALAANQYDAAADYFDRVVAVEPSNALALNNVAWLKLKLNRPGAVAVAERANQLLPNSPMLMDTLALTLAADSRLDEALGIQRKALELKPKDDGLKLGLARLLAQKGDAAGARKTLSELSKLVDGTPVGDEAAALASRLGDKK